MRKAVDASTIGRTIFSLLLNCAEAEARKQADADAENDEAQQKLTPRSQRNISRRQRLQASLKDVAAKLEVQASSAARTKKAAGAA